MKINKLLPTLLVWLTGHGRYKPEVQWSSKSWTHNVFRVYEMLFWRKIGIRKEAASYIDKGELVVKLYTFESVCAHLETLIRQFFTIDWSRVEVTQLQFALPNQALQIPWISFAIALDVANNGAASNSSPITWSHTCTGSNLLLIVGMGGQGGASASITSASYNSVSMTNVRTDNGSGTVTGATQSKIFFLASPATGSNTVSSAFTVATDYNGVAASYTGVSNSNSADATNGTNGATTGAHSFNVTTVADNCWVFGFGVLRASTSPVLSSPTQTSRANVANGISGVIAAQDTNAPQTPAGSVSIGWTTAGTSSFCYAFSGASFSPVSGAYVPTVTRTTRGVIGRGITR